MKKSYTLIFISLLFTLHSCDPYTQNSKTVINTSIYDLKLYRYVKTNSVNMPNDSFLIKSNTEQIIFAGGAMASEMPCVSDSIVLVVVNNPNLIVIKDLNINSSWINQKSGNGFKGYKSVCTARITNTDIVPK